MGLFTKKNVFLDTVKRRVIATLETAQPALDEIARIEKQNVLPVVSGGIPLVSETSLDSRKRVVKAQLAKDLRAIAQAIEDDSI